MMIRRRRGVGLGARLAVYAVGIGVVTAALVSWRATSILRGNKTAEFSSKGEAIALALAYSLGDRQGPAHTASIRAYLESTKTIEGVSYVYVQDAEGSILAHTFSEFPPYFEEQNRIAPGELGARRVKIGRSVDVPLADRVVQAIDVAAPIDGGAGGVVHVGMDRALIEAEASWFRSRMIATTVWVCLGTVLLTIAVAFREIRQPLVHLERAAQLISRGQFDACAREIATVVRRGDEIGAVALALGAAADQLASAMAVTRTLSRHMTAVVDSIDRTALSLSNDAESQAAGLAVAASGFQALIGSTEKLVEGLNRSQATVAELATAATAADRATIEIASTAYVVDTTVGRVQRTSAAGSSQAIAGLSSKIEALRQSCSVARDAMHTCLDIAMSFRRRVNEDLMLQLREKQHGDAINQALIDLGAVAQRQVKQAAILERISAELRRDFAKLTEVLTSPGEQPSLPTATLDQRRTRGGAKPSLTVVGKRSAS